jgi:site-specific recombinase XerD
MKNTGLRVGESRRLRWMDVEFVTNEDPSKCLLRIKVLKENSKTRKGSIVIGNEGSYNTLKEWFSLRDETSDFVEPDDFIWCDVDGRNINDFREGFNTLITNAGVSLDASGNKLTCYSLRHTYITEQLKSNVPIYTIASNCNTSVSMIETYYSDARNKDFEDALTKGYRKEASSSTKTPIKKTRKTATKTQKSKKTVSRRVKV